MRGARAAQPRGLWFTAEQANSATPAQGSLRRSSVTGALGSGWKQTVDVKCRQSTKLGCPVSNHDPESDTESLDTQRPRGWGPRPPQRLLSQPVGVSGTTDRTHNHTMLSDAGRVDLHQARSAGQLSCTHACGLGPSRTQEDVIFAICIKSKNPERLRISTICQHVVDSLNATKLFCESSQMGQNSTGPPRPRRVPERRESVKRLAGLWWVTTTDRTAGPSRLGGDSAVFPRLGPSMLTMVCRRTGLPAPCSVTSTPRGLRWCHGETVLASIRSTTAGAQGPGLRAWGQCFLAERETNELYRSALGGGTPAPAPALLAAVYAAGQGAASHQSWHGDRPREPRSRCQDRGG